MSSARWANILVCTIEAALLVQPVWWAPTRATRPWTCFVPNIAVLACKECTIRKRERLEHTDPSPTRLNVVSELRGAGETVSLTHWGLMSPSLSAVQQGPWASEDPLPSCLKGSVGTRSTRELCKQSLVESR